MRLFWIMIVMLSMLVACKNWNVEKIKPERVQSHQKVQIPNLPKYETVKNDPSLTQIYRLDNGLTLYLSPNPIAPRIQTLISVNAGSIHDPADATGLAHYLEHMLFKGTDRIGTVNYEEEKKYLDQIEILFEQLRKTRDTLARNQIYLRIDSLSQIAAKYSAPNELTMLYQAIGAKQTNAFTGSEYTGYVNDIPSNQLENWLKIEQERFRKPVLRLFHTELEAVYEEKNMGLDDPDRQMYYAMMEAVFPSHNYGQQTTIGTVEHLKSPSMKAIHDYYYAHYVPNNMAVHLAGDFNPKEAYELIKRYFGDWKPGNPPAYNPPAEKPITDKVVVKLESTEAPQLSITYRFNNQENPRAKYLATMVDMLLSNSKAGLIDLHINQPQKAIGAYSYHYPLKDYTLHVLGGEPTKGQSLQDLEALIMEQIQKIKKGDFPDALITAVVNNLKMDELEGLRSNRKRMYASLDAFSKGMSWQEKVAYLDILGAITKEEVIAFANQNYQNNYVVVYRNQVEETARLAIPKPPITPLEVSDNNQSNFTKRFLQENNPPKLLVDTTRADQLIVVDSLKNKAKWIYRKNSRDDLFEAKIYFPTGSNQSKTIVFAADLLQRCGTDSLSAQQISELWYNMGVSYSVAVGGNHTVVSFKGLTKQLEPAVKLFLHQLKYCVVNEEIFQAVKESVIQSRNNILTSKKELMWTGMRDYLVYGENSPLKFQLSNSEIQNLKAKALISEIQKTLKTPNQFTYYGEYEVETVESIWTKYFDTKSPAQKLNKDFNRLETTKTELFFIDQNSQQAEILLLSKGAPMQSKDWAIHELFNEYFGGSMSSIVFQELREKQALAYQVYASYASPKKANDSRYIIAYIGTQADKYFDALVGMKNLLDNLIIDSVKFEQSKLALIQRIESERIPEYSAIAMYLNAQEQGVPLNKNQILYNELPSLTIQDLKNYFEKYIQNQNYRIGIVGPKSEIDLQKLEKFGKVKTIEKAILFPY